MAIAAFDNGECPWEASPKARPMHNTESLDAFCSSCVCLGSRVCYTCVRQAAHPAHEGQLQLQATGMAMSL